ncbi:DUF4157 domain-containing protein [Nakamurella silvestris]|nr:DUF4157 domain-containing protein [Nakamurella silvestris]
MGRRDQHARTGRARGIDIADGSTRPDVRPEPPAPVLRPPVIAGLAFGDLHRASHGDDPLGGSVIPEDVRSALERRSGTGAKLPTAIADSMGEALGRDLSDVRIHHDAEAAGISRSVQAEAFTHGRDIYFGQGKFDTGSTGGKRLLAHELSHVVQGETAPGGGIIGRADDPAEREADRSADQVMGHLRSQTGPPAERAPGGADRAAVRRLATSEVGTVRRLKEGEEGKERKVGKKLKKFIGKGKKQSITKNQTPEQQPPVDVPQQQPGEHIQNPPIGQSEGRQWVRPGRDRNPGQQLTLLMGSRPPRGLPPQTAGPERPKSWVTGGKTTSPGQIVIGSRPRREPEGKLPPAPLENNLSEEKEDLSDTPENGDAPHHYLLDSDAYSTGVDSTPDTGEVKEKHPTGHVTEDDLDWNRYGIRENVDEQGDPGSENDDSKDRRAPEGGGSSYTFESGSPYQPYGGAVDNPVDEKVGKVDDSRREFSGELSSESGDLGDKKDIDDTGEETGRRTGEKPKNRKAWAVKSLGSKYRSERTNQREDLLASLGDDAWAMRNILEVLKTLKDIEADDDQGQMDLVRNQVGSNTAKLCLGKTKDQKIELLQKTYEGIYEKLKREDVPVTKDGVLNEGDLKDRFVKYNETQEEQEKAAVVVSGGKLVRNDKKMVDTKDGVTHFAGAGAEIFVVDKSGRIYMGSHKVSLFHHSSFLAGGDVAMAGELKVTNGSINWMSNKSGHYLPTRENFVQFLRWLEKDGVPLNFECRVGFTPTVVTTAQNLMDGIDGKGQEAKTQGYEFLKIGALWSEIKDTFGKNKANDILLDLDWHWDGDVLVDDDHNPVSPKIGRAILKTKRQALANLKKKKEEQQGQKGTGSTVSGPRGTGPQQPRTRTYRDSNGLIIPEKTGILPPSEQKSLPHTGSRDELDKYTTNNDDSVYPQGEDQARYTVQTDDQDRVQDDTVYPQGDEQNKYTVQIDDQDRVLDQDDDNSGPHIDDQNKYTLNYEDEDSEEDFKQGSPVKVFQDGDGNHGYATGDGEAYFVNSDGKRADL